VRAEVGHDELTVPADTGEADQLRQGRELPAAVGQARETISFRRLTPSDDRQRAVIALNPGGPRIGQPLYRALHAGRELPEVPGAQSGAAEMDMDAVAQIHAGGGDVVVGGGGAPDTVPAAQKQVTFRSRRGAGDRPPDLEVTRKRVGKGDSLRGGVG